ncbi:unnamed protein product [Bursaphelenchus xylophilus]|uniref:(pine wood nematode) hypothetical protein n=1 Tax=Bursaphelenchus xylophilus TaxID=6326 RepID=A0A1I7RH34_BURXY|nr:unnamed protein product [Bursaphelenchus xylophilus]CAG9115991.1 unnamed protein product [Bursaphelenchus xylophilus]
MQFIGAVGASSNLESSFYSSSEIQRSRPKVLPPTLTGNATRKYVGVRTNSEATHCLNHRTDFRLYHLWDQEKQTKLHEQLPLTVVYQSSRGIFFHWPIRTYGHFDERQKFLVDFYFIEDGGPSFKNLNNLIECYETKQYKDNGEIDVFRCVKPQSG